MAHAEKCPICEGRGKYWPEGWCASEPADCYGCDGKGWIEVRDGVFPLIDPNPTGTVPQAWPWGFRPYYVPHYSTGDYFIEPKSGYTTSG